MNIFAILSGLASWPFVLVVFCAVLVALLYGVGAAKTLRYDHPRRLRWWNYLAFGAGLLAVLAALHPALNQLAHSWFWTHMLQNETLAVVAAPLLLLGMPVWALWHVVPLPVRASFLRWGLRSGWPRRLWQSFSRWSLGPWLVWLLYVASFSIWHIPALYDAALTNDPLNALELSLFLVTGVLLWAQIVPLRPGASARLESQARIIYLCTVGMHSNLLGSLFVFSTAPFYPHYIALHPPASAALVDQHLAGTAMDVPGTILFAFALTVFLWFWLSEDERAGQSTTPSTSVSSTSSAAKP